MTLANENCLPEVTLESLTEKPRQISHRKVRAQEPMWVGGAPSSGLLTPRDRGTPLTPCESLVARQSSVAPGQEQTTLCVRKSV